MKFLYVQSAVLLYPYGAALLAGQDRRALSSVFVYHLCYVRVYLEQIARTAFGSKTAHYLLSHLEKHRLSRYHPAAAVAVRACGLQYVAYTLSGLLAGHLHKAELCYAEHVGLGAVLAQLLLEGFYDLFLIPGFVHIYEVDYYYAAYIAQAELPGYLLGGFAIGCGNGFLKVVRPNVFAGIDVNGGQRFGLIDYYIRAVFYPYLAAESLVYGPFEAEGVEPCPEAHPAAPHDP